jgi:hypothetical protein
LAKGCRFLKIGDMPAMQEIEAAVGKHHGTDECREPGLGLRRVADDFTLA